MRSLLVQILAVVLVIGLALVITVSLAAAGAVRAGIAPTFNQSIVLDAQHRLVIHGLVRRPLVFTLDALARYPMVSRMTFVECGGNSAPMFSNEAVQADVQAIHGLVSCAEWTGVRLSTLLESVRRLQAGLQSFLSMRRIEARRKNESAFRLRFSQSLASLRQRLSHAMVRSTIQRFGKTTNPLT